MLKHFVLVTGLLLWIPSVSAAAVPEPVQVAKKEKKPADVVVTEARVTQETIAGTVYYTLSGRIKNRSEEPVINPLVFYEIYSDENKIVAGGSLLVQPAVIPGNGEAIFESELNFGGQVRITLVEWLGRDRTPKANNQREFFPKVGATEAPSP
jgi:hypothetical protein